MANGSCGTIIGICVHPEDEDALKTSSVRGSINVIEKIARKLILTQARVQLMKPPRYVLFKPDWPNGYPFARSATKRGTSPAQQQDNTVAYNGERQTVHSVAAAAPVAAWAMTIDKCQGQNM